MEELELLKNELSAYETALEGSIIEEEEINGNLTELTIQLEKIRLEAKKVHDAIQEKKQHLNLIARDKRAREDAIRLRQQRIRAEEDKRKAEQGIAESIKARREAAMEAGYYWTDYALPHQWEGALTLAHFGNAMLADEMGLGKTLTSIMYLDMLRYEREGRMEFGAKKVLYVVPNDLVSEISRELTEWAPHRSVFPAQGPNPRYRALVNQITAVADNITVVTNYEALRNDHTWISEFEWDAVVIDEFHNAKDAEGLAFKRLKEIKSLYTLPMTATFILNSPEDIFPALNIILPDVFDDMYTFRRNFCDQGFDGKWTFSAGGETRLMERVGNRLVKRSMKEAGIELPGITESEVLIPASAIPTGQLKAMQEIDEALINIGDEAYPISAAIAQITRKRQAAVYSAGIEIKQTQADYDLAVNVYGHCDIPVGTTLAKIADDVPSVKIDWAVERLIQVIKAGKRAVVFSQFKTALTALDNRLKAEGIRSIRYDGDTDKMTRNEIKKDFKRTGNDDPNYKWDVVLCNYKTGGVGLTLTRATYMLKLDDEWNPGKDAQATRRIYRIGQTEPVLVETLRLDSRKHPETGAKVASIDLWMRDILQIKQALVDGFEAEVSIMDAYREQFAVSAKPEPAKELVSPTGMSMSDIDNLLEGL